MVEEIADFLLNNINISVSGACGPLREQPIQCYYPTYQKYRNASAHPTLSTSIAIPGGVPRAIDSMAAREGVAIVYDRDLLTTWRLPTPIAAYEVFF